jgi:phage terminase small subunit
MPKYDPAIHEPITISLYENDFVKAYTDIDSPTFGNAYQSAVQAGYAPSYARVILHYFPKWRLKQAQQKLSDPLTQSFVKELRYSEPRDIPAPKRVEKRMKAEANRKFGELMTEMRLLEIDN